MRILTDILDHYFDGHVYAARDRYLAICTLACALLLSGTAAYAQGRGTEGGATRDPDDLPADNSALVTASAGEIGGVLRGDPGLFLELKYMVAQKAGEVGQVAVESDLTDEAILARIRDDRKFRAAATLLLQRYGYLLPKAKGGSGGGGEKEARASEAERGKLAKEEEKAPERAVGSERTVANPAELPRDGQSSETLIDPSAAGGGALSEALASGGGSSHGGSGGDASLLMASAGSSSAASALGGAVSGPEVPTLTTPGLVQSQPAAEVAAPSRERASSGDRFAVEAAAEAALPSVLRHKSPYSDLPSIYDMYIHSSPPSGSVTRFGEEIFHNSADALGTIPIDFPASPDYVVGPGDGLTINLWGGVSQRLYSTVDHEGRITLPEIGPLLVSGQSLGQVQLAVQRSLRTQFRDVSADVSLSRLRTVRVYVVGDVNGPGAYDVSSLSTPLNVLIAAGGPTSGGSLRIVKQYRGDVLIQQVDLYDLFLRGLRSDLKRLEPGDTLVVPAVGDQVRIDGMVRRPALYELQGETNLAEVIDLAGGLLPTASLNHIEVQRLEDHEKRTMVSLDVSGSTDPAEIEKKLAAFTIRDRDEIHIFPIVTFNQDAVYLLGHVLREGRYAYKPGMRLTDLVSSYADLLPEPAMKYAEIIHLVPPDYHPSVENVDLGAALANPANAPKLQPLDTVRIFSRFDFEDSPSVSVSGAVRHGGTFTTLGQTHFRDAIQLAGGLTPDASMDTAQIIRPMPDSSMNVLSIHLKEAMEGDPINNVLLQPLDHILIQQNILHDDPVTVLVEGAVANPGRYPLTPNLRVSDVVELAGGLKRSADTDSADLTQFITGHNAPIVATHVNVNLSAAMVGDSKEDTTLHDGDVLTIRQIPGWDDLGASVTVEGEVKHPGSYGIRAGERLSAVLERAGGFQPEGYPYGAILERSQVQGLEVQARDELMSRIKNAQTDLELQKADDPKAEEAKELAVQQWESNLRAVGFQSSRRTDCHPDHDRY